MLRIGDTKVVGISCRLPWADCPTKLWELLSQKVDVVGDFPTGRQADVGHVLPLYAGRLKDPTRPFCCFPEIEEVGL